MCASPSVVKLLHFARSATRFLLISRSSRDAVASARRSASSLCTSASSDLLSGSVKLKGSFRGFFFIMEWAFLAALSATSSHRGLVHETLTHRPPKLLDLPRRQPSVRPLPQNP